MVHQHTTPVPDDVVETTTIADTPSSTVPKMVVTERVPAGKLRGLYQFERVIYIILGIIEALIAFRFVLKMLGANEGSPFTALIYGVTNPLVRPFTGIFPPSASGAYVIEPDALVAMLVYLLVAWLIVKLAWVISGLP